MRRGLLLFLLAAALLTVPVFADMGPRPCLKNVNFYMLGGTKHDFPC